MLTLKDLPRVLTQYNLLALRFQDGSLDAG